MVQKTNKDDQIIVRIDMENGMPRVRQVTGEELKQFVKTRQKSKLPTFSLEHVNRVATTLENMNQAVDPRTIRVVNNPSAK
jgi:hypothetical protein